MKIDVLYLKSDVHMRPMRFNVLCTSTDSSDKTQVMCSTILLCLFYRRLIVMQPSWTTVPCPTTKLSSLISKSFVGIKQSVISVALRTPLKNKIGNLCLQNSTSRSTRWLCWFYTKLPPHILQQNCAHGY